MIINPKEIEVIDISYDPILVHLTNGQSIALWMNPDERMVIMFDLYYSEEPIELDDETAKYLTDEQINDMSQMKPVFKLRNRPPIKEKNYCPTMADVTRAIEKAREIRRLEKEMKRRAN